MVGVVKIAISSIQGNRIRGVRIHDFALNVGHKVEYRELVQFALNLVDSLLFVHYLAVLLMELRHKQSEYYIKVR